MLLMYIQINSNALTLTVQKMTVKVTMVEKIMSVFRRCP